MAASQLRPLTQSKPFKVERPLTCPIKTCVAPPTLPATSSIATSFLLGVGVSGYAWVMFGPLYGALELLILV